MPGVAEMGMVWMGAGQSSGDMPIGGLMPGDSSDMMLEHENMYYTPSHHSLSNQSIEDMHAVHSSHMVSYFDLKQMESDAVINY